VTGRATATTTAMVAELVDTLGNFLLVAEGYGASDAQLAFGGLVLTQGVGVNLVGGSVNSLLGGVTYDLV